MAGRKLAHTVIVIDPDTGQPESLLAGDVPDERFADLIGDHAFEADEGTVAAGDRAGYEALKKDQLEQLVADREAAGRELDVAAPGNKPQLVDALLADDAAQE